MNISYSWHYYQYYLNNKPTQDLSEGMSLFYKNKQPQKAVNENQSIVQPFAGFKETVPPSKMESKAAVVDPTFPAKHKNQKEGEDGMRRSILLQNGEDEKQSWLTKCCSCPNLESYKKFFHVTNQNVLKRILLNLQFWSTGFFVPEEEYDFYGPFWILTTVVFCLCAVPNIILYQSMSSFQYDFEIVGIAFGFIYLEGFLFPVILTFILKLLGVDCTYIQNTCIYGYSMCTVVICLLLCSINSCILHIVLLCYAFATKAWFILNNMLSSYAIPIPKKALITGLVVGEAILQFFVIKVFFVKCAQEESTTQSPHHMMISHLFHSRSYLY